MTDARDRLIVALDAPDGIAAGELVIKIGDATSYYKIGNELFTAEGPAFVQELIGSGRRIFLDLKFHDIPNTVAGGVRTAASLGVSMLTVHAAGGLEMMKAAVEAAAQSESKPIVVAVTVLTSLSSEDLPAIGVTGTVDAQVARLAALALQAGCGGVVASAREAGLLRQSLGTGFTLVTPGIRPADDDLHDQARAVTPAAAIRAGADYLVVGRPIIAAADPKDAATAILHEIEHAG